eukprot:Clim_evm18s239 gene=Clim_evmTU18s239
MGQSTRARGIGEAFEMAPRDSTRGNGGSGSTRVLRSGKVVVTDQEDESMAFISDQYKADDGSGRRRAGIRRTEDSDSDVDMPQTGSGSNGYQLLNGTNDHLDMDHRHHPILQGDRLNFTFLVMLYMMQGIPLGLTMGSIPFLLKKIFDFHDLAIFSFAAYPYSLKILWSPLVDTKYFTRIGRRKSWIVPVQLVLGVLFLLLSLKIEDWVFGEKPDLHSFTFIFFVLVTCAATQDIAVDGWAVTLLKPENNSFASTAQTLGLGVGFAISHTLFLAFNDLDMSNEYVRKYAGLPSQDYPIVGLSEFLQFWGFAFFAATVVVIFMPEVVHHETVDDLGIKGAFRDIWSVLQLHEMKVLLALLLIHKFAFAASDNVAPLVLMDKSFHQSDLALIAVLDFPVQFGLSFYIAALSRGRRPLQPWYHAQWIRLALGLAAMGVIAIFPVSETEAAGKVPMWYFVAVVVVGMASSASSSAMFICQGAFFTRIADPKIGGTYLTLLNTFSNFGGTWPRSVILYVMDLVSNAEGGDSTAGYYITASFCVIMGTLVMYFLVRPKTKLLEELPKECWRVQKRAA